MDIQINGCAVDFELEQEKALPEVVSSINGWARERDLVFMEARLDDASYPVDAVPNLPLDRVRVLNCVVQSRADVVVTTLEEGIAYCDRVLAFMESFTAEGDGAGPDLASLAAGMDWLRDVSATVLGLLGLEPAQVGYRDASVREALDALVQARESIARIRSPREAAAFFAVEGGRVRQVREIFSMLLKSDHVRALVMRSIDSPDMLFAALNGIAGEMQVRAQAAADAAAAYQAGKDADGYAKLDELTEFLYRYFRSCKQGALTFKVEMNEVAVGGVSLEEKNRVLHNLIAQMHAALENNDIITLSDVLEYELKPALEGLDAHVKALLDRMSAA